MAKRFAVAVCLLVASLLPPADTAEAAQAQGRWPTTDPWAIMERELGPAFDAVSECLRNIYGCAADVVASIWDYCEPDFSGTGEDDLDEAQELLDCLGLIPGIGIAFDTVNATVSLTQGDWGDAAMSAVFIVPILGQKAAAAKITVKSRVTKSITIEALEKAKKAQPIRRAAPLPSPSDTVSVKANVQHNKAPGPSSRHLGPGLKRKAGIPESEFHLWTKDHSIPRSMHSAEDMHKLNDPENLRVLTVDANQVKSRIEDAVVNWADDHGDDVVDFVVDHGTNALRPAVVTVKIYVNGGEPIVATIPNVHGAASVAAIRIPRNIDNYGEALRLAGAVQRVVDGSAADSVPAAPGGTPGGSSASAAQPRSVPTLTITTSSAGDRCAGCRWMVGSGSGWAPGERFHVRCSGGGEAFADTSTNKGAKTVYRARYASPSGEISWGNQICYSDYSETLIEVWNTSGQRASVTVTAGDSAATATTAAQPRSVPTLTITTSSAGDRCAGCRWMVGSGSGWAPGERFHVRCSGGGEAFADTSTNKGAKTVYRARYASPSGEISWGNQICYSDYSETVIEVWNTSGQRASVTVR